MPELLTIPKASQTFSISAATIRKWIKTGRLEAWDKTLGKRRPVWLVRTADVLRLLGQYPAQPHTKRIRTVQERKILTDDVLRKWGIVA